MASLGLSDLHNPEHIKAIMLKNGTFVDAAQDQGFQVLEKSIELWQMLDGKLRLVKRWRRFQSVLMLYY